VLKTFVTALVWLTPEGTGQHLESDFGQQIRAAQGEIRD